MPVVVHTARQSICIAIITLGKPLIERAVKWLAIQGAEARPGAGKVLI